MRTSPLVIIEVRRKGAVVEYDRMRPTPEQFLFGVWPTVCQIGIDENPEEIIVRIMRPTRE